MTYVCNVSAIFEGNLTENPRDRVRVVRRIGVKSSQIIHLSIYKFNSWLLVLFPVKTISISKKSITGMAMSVALSVFLLNVR
jgi:membrane-anchored protein YejM (alkaline phosphatase superfamily)